MPVRPQFRIRSNHLTPRRTARTALRADKLLFFLCSYVLSGHFVHHGASERRRAKDRFGGDIVYFLNDAACQECERLGLNLQFLAEISDDELPRRRTLVVGMPERTGGIGSSGHRQIG